MTEAPAATGGGDSYHHGDLPSALLSAVGTLIDRHGVGAVSLRAAAREVGVSHAAPAHHFGDKRGLLTAFAFQGYEAFSAALAAAWDAAPADDPRAGLRAIGQAYLEFARTHRAHFEVMFRPELAELDTIAKGEDTTDAFRVLQVAVAANLPDAGPDDADVLRLALTAWCMIHGLVELWFDGPLSMMHDQLTLEQLEASLADAMTAVLDAERHAHGST